MKIHIITIGDEILIGQVLNTNAGTIGNLLGEINLTANKTSVVGDNEEDIINEFRETWKKNDVIITTGGLGPTHDDITRTCLVKFFNTQLVKDEEVFSDIKNLFHVRGREVTKVNENQALVPKVAKVLRNSFGTAPGLWIEKEKKVMIVLPGVPYEMEMMMKNLVIPKLMEKYSKDENIFKRLVLQTTGIPESTLYERLGNLEEILGDAKMAFLPSLLGVRLRVTVETNDEETAQNKLIEIEQKIKSKAGRYVFASGEIALEEVIARLLKERNLRIAVAESCTGGLVSNILTNVSGSSDYFDRGIVSYSNASKVEILNVNEDVISEYGAVSLEVARQMAEGVKAISGTDIGLSTTGIMGPTGATPGKQVGLVYIGFCDDTVCTAKKFLFGDNRIFNKQRTAQAALEMIRRALLGIPFDD
jgi:competence/damage-inducible protein CinA-like protein